VSIWDGDDRGVTSHVWPPSLAVPASSGAGVRRTGKAEEKTNRQEQSIRADGRLREERRKASTLHIHNRNEEQPDRLKWPTSYWVSNTLYLCAKWEELNSYYIHIY
jgi:hypothetical protein